MTDRTRNVLFLCMKNTARSIMAEALLQRWGGGAFRGYSAGAMPRDSVHPLALKLLRQNNFDVSAFRSKGWEEFTRSDAPQLDLVITVCNRAANETCPAWPGDPAIAHWAIENPDVRGLPDALLWERFCKAYWELEYRIKALVALPVAQLDTIELRMELDAIGRSQAEMEGTAEAG